MTRTCVLFTNISTRSSLLMGLWYVVKSNFERQPFTMSLRPSLILRSSMVKKRK